MGELIWINPNPKTSSGDGTKAHWVSETPVKGWDVFVNVKTYSKALEYDKK